MWVEFADCKIDIGPHPSKVCLKRWTGAMSPEPETVAWINSLPEEGVFYDIGANVGTITARAVFHGLNVFAFEPDRIWYNELCEILIRNDIEAACFPIALSNNFGVGYLASARSSHSFFECREEHPIVGVVALPLDMLTGQGAIPYPSFVKLDVDGNELDILLGMRQTLRHVRSMLIEVDPQAGGNSEIPAFMEQHGFVYDKEQVEACTIRGGKYSGMANWIFYRK